LLILPIQNLTSWLIILFLIDIGAQPDCVPAKLSENLDGYPSPSPQDISSVAMG